MVKKSIKEFSKYGKYAKIVEEMIENDNIKYVKPFYEFLSNKMSVKYEIEGGFSNYVNFRNVLSNKPKIVNIEEETISKSEDSGGAIKAKATVSLVKNVN